MRSTRHEHACMREAIARFGLLMNGGYWICDGSQPVTFDDDGRLIDGRCRLEAIIISRTPVELYVCGWRYGPRPLNGEEIA